MTKKELIEALEQFSDDCIVNVYVRDHYDGLERAEIASIKLVHGRIHIISDLGEGVNSSGCHGFPKITFRSKF